MYQQVASIEIYVKKQDKSRTKVTNLMLLLLLLSWP